MTNPDNSFDIPTPFPPETITSIAYYKPNLSKFVPNGNLWIGTRDGSLYIAEEVIGSRISFIFRSTMRTARKNFLVKEIIPVYEDPPCTLVHWVGGNNQPGPVQVIYPGGIRVQIFEEANHLLYTTRNKTKVSSSDNRGLIAIVSGESVTFFEFIGDMVIEKSKIEQLTDGFIEAIELGENSLLYFAKGRYHKYDLNDGTDTKISTSTIGELKNKINPFIVKVTPKTFILGYKEFMMIIGLKTREGEAMIQYDKNNRIPNRILIFRDVMYQFFGNIFTRQPIIPPQAGADPQVFNFNDVSLSCMVNDNLVIVTPTSVLIIGTIPQPSDMANKIIECGEIYDEFEDLMKKLSNEQVSEIVSDIFDILWQNEKYEIAFDLISTHLILNNVNKYISLMPILIIEVPDENAINVSTNAKNQQANFDADQTSSQKGNQSKLKPLEENDKRYLNKMLDFLIFTRSMYMKNVFKFRDLIRDVNTALAQCYAAFTKTRELDELIAENHLYLKPLQFFIKERAKLLPLNPSYAILESNIGEVDDAINIWQKLDHALAKNNKYNPMFITEASFAIQKLKDSTNLISYLNWVLERDPNSPELAINAILSVNHDPSEINNWLSSKGLDNYKLRYSVYIVTQSTVTNSNYKVAVSAGKASSLANETFIPLLKILADIDNSDFDLNRLQFTKSSKSGTTGGIYKLNAKKEIFQYLMQILELHADSINETEAEDHITDNMDIKIKYTLYRVKRMYEKGLKLMLKNANDSKDNFVFPTEKVEEFCRLAPEPDVAFSVLIKMIDPNDLIPKFKQFILDNLVYMNLVELVSNIPKNLKINEVQLILKKAYNILQSRVYSLDNQISIAKSIKVDTQYRKTQLQANFCYIKKEITCAKCGNKILEEQQFVMAPGGTNMLVYHPRCKPALFT